MNGVGKVLNLGSDNSRFNNNVLPSNLVENKITSEQDNMMLMNIPQMSEVGDIVRSVKKRKAPGSDGIIAEFFQSCWPVTKNDILHVNHKLFFLLRLLTMKLTTLCCFRFQKKLLQSVLIILEIGLNKLRGKVMWATGDSSVVKMGVDPWDSSVQSGQFLNLATMPVFGLVDNSKGQWNGDLIFDLFEDVHVNAILIVPHPIRQLMIVVFGWMLRMVSFL